MRNNATMTDLNYINTNISVLENSKAILECMPATSEVSKVLDANESIRNQVFAHFRASKCIQ